MFVHNTGKKIALLMSNDLKGCQEDVEKIEKILLSLNFDVILKKKHCYPKKEITSFLKEQKINSEDLLYIHYSGHGIKRGKKIGEEYKVLTAWLNPNRTVTTSDEIDKILSEIKCNKILTTDCCHSASFGDFYKGNTPLIFIGTSTLSTISKTYSLNGGPLKGSLVHLFEYMLNNNIELTLEKMTETSKEFFLKNKMESKLIVKTFN